MYYVSLGYSKTFTVSLERTASHQLKEVAFLNLGKLLMLFPCVPAILCPQQGDKGLTLF